MADRFAPKEAIGLYGVVLAGSFVFFILGVYVGKEFRSLPVPPPDPTEAEAAEARPDLELYETLVPEGGVAGPGPGAGDSAAQEPTPTEQTAAAPPREVQPAPATQQRAPSQSARPASGGAAAADPTPLPTTYFTVQVAALTSRDEASQIVLRLETKEYPSQVVPPEPGNRYFRVWVGEAITRAEADRLAERLRADGFHTYVKPVRRTSPN